MYRYIAEALFYLNSKVGLLPLMINIKKEKKIHITFLKWTFCSGVSLRRSPASVSGPHGSSYRPRTAIDFGLKEF